MAATVSSVWAKPGAWALDSEEHEEELKQDLLIQSQKPKPEPPAAEFPSLAAAASKPKKKNKGQTLSLAEFSTYSSAPSKRASATEPQRLTQDELLMLPTGPRQRTAEELDRDRLGGGFRNYGGGLGDSSRDRVRGDRSNNREGYNGNSNRDRDMGPSRADEVDDWSKSKKFNSSNSFGSERGDRRERVGGFFNSSRADEVDNWAAGKSLGPAQLDPPPRRERRMGFDSHSNGGSDSDNWLKKKEERAGAGADSDTWGRKREDFTTISNNGNGNSRPRLNLQPRTLPVANNNNNEGGKGKGENPFGEARPREEVLAEKGKDWKEIDEKLEAVKIKEGEKSEGFGRRRGFGIGKSDSGDAKTWRKPESNAPVSPSLSAEKTEEDAEQTVESTEGTEDTATTEKVAEEN